ncbi:MAG: hypothetical protein RR406_00040 [Bacilli bacterium]
MNSSNVCSKCFNMICQYELSNKELVDIYTNMEYKTKNGSSCLYIEGVCNISITIDNIIK